MQTGPGKTASKGLAGVCVCLPVGTVYACCHHVHAPQRQFNVQCSVTVDTLLVKSVCSHHNTVCSRPSCSIYSVVNLYTISCIYGNYIYVGFPAFFGLVRKAGNEALGLVLASYTVLLTHEVVVV